jgi:dephospho-CoA kinase
MPGSGKATARKLLREMGYETVVMGDVIRKEANRRNLKPTLENIGLVMLKLREEEGPEIVAKHCISKIKTSEANMIVVDGVRSLEEVNEFKEHFPRFKLIAIHASPQTRFHRLLRRKRSDDPKNWRTFRKRDLRELKVGLGNVVAMADYIVANEGTKAQLRKRIHYLLEGKNVR